MTIVKNTIHLLQNGSIASKRYFFLPLLLIPVEYSLQINRRQTLEENLRKEIVKQIVEYFLRHVYVYMYSLKAFPILNTAK